LSRNASRRDVLHRLLREPLVHFLVLGLALFGVYRLSTTRSPGSERIVVSSGKVQTLVETFRLTWQRPPTPEELQGLIADFIKEEVLVREARQAGLDQDDPLVRRRLRTRMEILSDDTAAIRPPSDAQLEAYLATHRDAFQVDGRTTFVQLYLSPERRGPRLDSDLRKTRELLERAGPGTDVARLSDSVMLDTRYDAISDRDVVRIFGEEFAGGLAAAPLGRWSEPLRSGYGAHLVRVIERVPGRSARLEEVREAVQREWLAEETARARQAALDTLLRKYQVRVEPAAVETVSPRAAR
jgi:hypothetical protein